MEIAEPGSRNTLVAIKRESELLQALIEPVFIAQGKAPLCRFFDIDDGRSKTMI
jgi:hypothetical protein